MRLQKTKPDNSRGERSTLNFSTVHICSIVAGNSNKQTQKTLRKPHISKVNLEHLLRDREVSIVGSRKEAPHEKSPAVLESDMVHGREGNSLSNHNNKCVSYKLAFTKNFAND